MTDRFARHLALPFFDENCQNRLASATVGVVGAGGLGCPALAYLAAAGVGQIVIADDDRVEESNLHRQILFSEADLGQKKAAAAASRLQKMNSKIFVEPFLERLTADNALDFFEKCDVVLDGSDNFPTRYLCDDAAFLSQKPLVFGAVSGLEGQVSTFHFSKNAGERGFAYRDLHPAPPAHGSVLSCAEAGVLGPAAGAVGAMMALEAVKILTGIGQPLTGRLWLFDGLGFSSRVLKFSKNESRPTVSGLIDYELFCGLKKNGNGLKNAFLSDLLAQNPSARVIDVREPSEFETGKWPDSENAPLAELAVFSKNWPLSEPLVLVCASGKRSASAVDFLKNQGFENVRSLEGGLFGA